MIITETETITYEKEVENVTSIICDFCHKDLTDDFKISNGQGTVRIGFGYGSGFDGDSFALEICDDCFLKHFGRLLDKQFMERDMKMDMLRAKIEELENEK